MALAFNRRPFPGAMGWRRYVGMACIGGPLGTMSGQLYFESLQQERWFKATLLRQNAAHANYSTLERLARDDQFLASLPWLARRYLSHKLQKEERLMIQYSRSIPPEPQPPTVTSVTSAEQNSPSSTDMSGCEYDGFGRRIYVNSPDKFGVEQLQQYIQYVENARARITAELNYVREDLARREPEYFKLSEYTPEKEALHITLRHLSSWVLTLQMERSMAENIIVDASKQLAQLEQQQTGSETSWTPPKTDLPGTCHSPAMTANSLQRHWTRHRHQLSILEDVEKEGILKDDSIVEPLVTYAQFKRRVKAMERLLKDYEDKVAEAELNNSKQF
ncbi:hypothetical protein EJ04DRAFT_516195 [Polyplosphaeria fusca]|uniref:Uncharacterized protein n=1 Tax=Polyplosphaeria fusca TaxID=682080 RepID=A0A9P4QP00_9PLEO|nr:hypothetical protein EJ04DRAFT_516195 [Polyplosphaeria fusca]